MSSFPQTHRPSYGQIQSVLELYLRLLKANPIITKSITSGIIACAGSSLSQALSRGEVSMKVSRSFLIFGSLVTGPVTHYLYIALDRLFPGTGLAKSLLRVLTDRLVFSPAFLFVTIYLLGRLQGLTNTEALDSVKEKYVASLLANWKIWTLPQIININLVAPQYRVLFANVVALVWNFYLASARKK
eukprot:TRINITY_DN46621_c0_g1_i1.p1 TRINITY_DN46621_c0_g1~~TRINITY_DN46621_c0_g1_i1.p1  ORF type:complete len:187 (+),score=27.00 TRINITY_DN46621_c0_g1_i1:32-592(+)